MLIENNDRLDEGTIEYIGPKHLHEINVNFLIVAWVFPFYLQTSFVIFTNHKSPNYICKGTVRRRHVVSALRFLNCYYRIVFFLKKLCNNLYSERTNLT